MGMTTHAYSPATRETRGLTGQDQTLSHRKKQTNKQNQNCLLLLLGKNLSPMFLVKQLSFWSLAEFRFLRHTAMANYIPSTPR